jgi:4-hydroxybenzoate polyprenyltransferase
MPQGHLSPAQAKVTMICLYVAAQFLCFQINGGVRQGIILVLLGTWYNNFRGADSHPFVRNAINALGYLCFISGATEVALGEPIPFAMSGLPFLLLQWFSMLGGMVLTTIHVQDMPDQEGDALRGRRTVPLVIGDGRARWTIAVSMLVWCILCPAMWVKSAVLGPIIVGLSVLIGARTLLHRDMVSDKRTFIIWNVWVSILYLLPLF